MNFKRFFTTSPAKGLRNYLNSQKKYEVIRTVVYFAISISLFAAGFIATGDRMNLLTIVAILGCLPASNSMVQAIMFCRYKSLSDADAQTIEKHSDGLNCLYDMIFTSREKTYPVLHLTVCGNTIAGYMPVAASDTDCAKHLETYLKVDNFTNVTIKIFHDVNKYTERLKQIKELQDNETLSEGIINTLKNISL